MAFSFTWLAPQMGRLEQPGSGQALLCLHMTFLRGCLGLSHSMVELSSQASPMLVASPEASIPKNPGKNCKASYDVDLEVRQASPPPHSVGQNKSQGPLDSRGEDSVRLRILEDVAHLGAIFGH